MKGGVAIYSKIEGGITMGEKIKWENVMDSALARARSEKKHVLLDFFNPG
jgi:hypothetical protein